MRSRASLSNFFSRDRKKLYIILGIVMMSVLTLTVVYAALSTTLNINGQAEVSAANWDIHLDNVVLNNSSATTAAPTITDPKTASFSTTLTKPGDFYEFTIDVVNNGSIDAMIDSVTKTPELSLAQKKYLNYIVEYQNGESITSKQLVAKGSFVRLKVKVEFRKDITSSDLATTSETLNLSFKVNYVQSDETTVSVENNGKWPKIVSGDLDTVGSEVAIEDEHFYVISSDEESVTMLAKYNLYVGGIRMVSGWTAYGEEATGTQDFTMKGWNSSGLPFYGVLRFSNTNYWNSTISEHPAYVYNSNSELYNHVENYKKYLESHGTNIMEARLITIEELENLGCSRLNENCSNAPEWVYATSYWLGSSYDSETIWIIDSNSELNDGAYSARYGTGLRPVIKILKSAF